LVRNRIKAGFDNNEGVYNPENTVPNQGLTSLGLQFRWDRLFINQRMAVRKAKMQMQLSQAERNFKQLPFCMMLR
jgi:hypothetical protein